jgi:hypothetical protein
MLWGIVECNEGLQEQLFAVPRSKSAGDGSSGNVLRKRAADETPPLEQDHAAVVGFKHPTELGDERPIGLFRGKLAAW